MKWKTIRQFGKIIFFFSENCKFILPCFEWNWAKIGWVESLGEWLLRLLKKHPNKIFKVNKSLKKYFKSVYWVNKRDRISIYWKIKLYLYDFGIITIQI